MVEYARTNRELYAWGCITAARLMLPYRFWMKVQPSGRVDVLKIMGMPMAAGLILYFLGSAIFNALSATSNGLVVHSVTITPGQARILQLLASRG